MIPNGIILIWLGTEATIPSGWERVASLDGKFLKGSGTESPNTTGGNATHSHSSSAHGHTMNSHTHAVVLTNVSSGSGNADDSDPRNLADNHGHNSASIGGTSGGSLADTSVTWSSVNHEPPYYEVVYITPTSSELLKNDIAAFWNGETLPTDWYYCDGNNDTPDLRNKYLKGAAAESDAGGTGGATSHAHSVSHTHTSNSHTHSGTSGSMNPNAGRQAFDLSGSYARRPHTHTINLSGTTQAINSYTNTSAGSGDTVEPLHKKIGVIQNKTGGADNPRFIIGMWLGSIESIPAGWEYCNGDGNTPDLRDYYAKVTDTAGNIGNTAGANSHQHSSISHTHTANGTHSHSGSTSGPSATSGKNGQQNNGWTNSTHTHPLQSVSSVSATYQNNDITCNSSSNEPEYRVVAFVQYDFIQSTVTIEVNASIKNNVSESINSKSRIEIQSEQSIDAKANVIGLVTRTVSAQGRIGQTQAIKAKGDIKLLDIEKNINAKGSVQRDRKESITANAYLTATAYKYISSKAWIYRSGIINKPNFGGVTLPFPDYADIQPDFEDSENTALNGKTRTSIMGRKYRYTMQWDYLKVEYYEALESVINDLGAAYFNYGKWPQSTDGTLCLGRLSRRQLTYGTGNEFYLSDVTLNLIEVNSRI